MILLLLSTLGLAQVSCPELFTVPADGETDVPPSLAVIVLGPPTALRAPTPLTCTVDRVVLTETETGELVMAADLLPVGLIAVGIPELQPDTSYTLTIEGERDREPAPTFEFTTGAPRPSEPPPEPQVLSARAWSAGDLICAEVTATVDAPSRWMVVYSNFGSPSPWTRAEPGEQTITLSTADTHRPTYGGGPRDTLRARVIVQSLLTNEQVIGEQYVDVERASPEQCPAPAAYESARESGGCYGCSQAGQASSLLALLPAFVVSLLRRRRRRSLPRGLGEEG